MNKSIKTMTPEERRIRMEYLMGIKSYLHDLNCFTLKEKTEVDLLTVDQTRELLRNSKHLTELNKPKITIPFDQKSSTRFKNFLNNLQESNSSGVCIWIEGTKQIGTTIFKSIFEINWEFNYYCLDSGVFTLLSLDYQGSILFDFYEESSEKLIDIFRDGAKWPFIEW